LVPSRSAVDTHREIVIAFARLKDTSVIVCGHVPVAPHYIVDVFAVPCSIAANASTEAELFVRNEARPFVVLQIRRERVAKDKTADRVAIAISSVGVKLSSSIALLNVDFGEVAHASHLHVIGSLDEVHAFKSSRGESPSAPTGFGTPCHFNTFGVSDGLTRCGWAPKAEVINTVEPGSLALRRLRRRGTTSIGAGLPDLGFLRKGVKHVAGVPNLVRRATVTLPNLNLVAGGKVPVGQVDTLVAVDPGKCIGEDVIVPLLIRVARAAGPNLEFDAIRVDAVRDIQAFCTENFDVTASKSPFLGVATSARLNGDGGAISVGGGSHALSRREPWLDEQWALIAFA